jgi:hypothetical protein
VTSTSPGCAVCARPSERRLCSPPCVREAVHEREHNVRHLRTLRRTGGDDAGAALIGRNAVLTAALLTERPRGIERPAGDEVSTSTVGPGASPDGAEESTQPFVTPAAVPASAVAGVPPVA